MAATLSLVAFSPVHRAGEAAALSLPSFTAPAYSEPRDAGRKLSPDFLNVAGSSQCLQHGVVRTGHNAVA